MKQRRANEGEKTFIVFCYGGGKLKFHAMLFILNMLIPVLCETKQERSE